MIKKISAVITAMGGYVPDGILSNADLEKMVDTNDEWIVARTGIKERRILLGEDQATSDMVVPAVLEICSKRNLKPEEIECIIVATITPDMQMPATASIVGDKIGATNAWAFDVNSACCGFIYALSIGASLIEGGRYKNVVVVGADKMSSIINEKDRNTCILFGDGAGAALLEASEEALGVMDSIFKSDGKGRNALTVRGGGSLNRITEESIKLNQHYVYQDGKTVFKAAVNGMSSVSKELMKKNDLEIKYIDWLVPHQANLRIIDAVAKEINMPKQKIKVNLQRYGNTTAATIPLCLWEMEKTLKKNDSLVLTAFGAGFSWGATWLRWGYDSN
jgi:3-oxoacyl-[acyl-carrier-protein] synthase-3